jgi:hypothetical protein
MSTPKWSQPLELWGYFKLRISSFAKTVVLQYFFARSPFICMKYSSSYLHGYLAPLISSIFVSLVLVGILAAYPQSISHHSQLHQTVDLIRE